MSIGFLINLDKTDFKKLSGGREKLSIYKEMPAVRNRFVFIFLFLVTVAFCADSFHILQNGETLYSISRKYKISLQLLLDSNNIEDASRIKAGQKIFIPSGYTVKNGDTIYGIARDLNVSAEDLMSLNELNEFSMIKVGDVLLIPPRLDSSNAIASSSGSSRFSSNSSSKKASQGSSSKNLAKTPPLDDYKPLSDPRNYSKKSASTSLLWPVPAKKTFYLEGKVKGIVIESNKGEDVKSITSGKVISMGVQRGFGNVVFVQSATSHIYVYGGLDKITVKPNQMLSLNDRIGKIGQEAFSGNARLFFIVYDKNKPIDPAKAPRGF